MKVSALEGVNGHQEVHAVSNACITSTGDSTTWYLITVLLVVVEVGLAIGVLPTVSDSARVARDV